MRITLLFLLPVLFFATMTGKSVAAVVGPAMPAGPHLPAVPVPVPGTQPEPPVTIIPPTLSNRVLTREESSSRPRSLETRYAPGGAGAAQPLYVVEEDGVNADQKPEKKKAKAE
jgi:hypothetical protein